VSSLDISVKSSLYHCVRFVSECSYYVLAASCCLYNKKPPSTSPAVFCWRRRPLGGCWSGSIYDDTVRTFFVPP